MPRPLPDLDQIHLYQAVFMECLIANGAHPVVGPDQVAGFADPSVVVLPYFNPELKLVSFDVQVGTQALDEEGEPLSLTGSFRVHLSFQVQNLPDLLHTSKLAPRPTPSPELSTMLVGAAYSTARGMIMSKVADTVLGGFSLPLRSIAKLMQDSNEILREQMDKRAATPKRARKRKPDTSAE